MVRQRDERQERLSYNLTVGFLLLVGVVCCIGALLAGCCKSPECVPKARLLPVAQGCTLPPGPGPLPVPKRVEENCPHTACYDTENAAKLAGRDSILKQWIRETKARCADAGVPDGPRSSGDAQVRPD